MGRGGGRAGERAGMGRPAAGGGRRPRPTAAGGRPRPPAGACGRPRPAAAAHGGARVEIKWADPGNEQKPLLFQHFMPMRTTASSVTRPESRIRDGVPTGAPAAAGGRPRPPAGSRGRPRPAAAAHGGAWVEIEWADPGNEQKPLCFQHLMPMLNHGKFCHGRRIRDPRRGPYGSGERTARSDGQCPLTPIL